MIASRLIIFGSKLFINLSNKINFKKSVLILIFFIIILLILLIKNQNYNKILF